VRGLACGVALDTLAEMWIHEQAGKGDLEPRAKVCHRYVSGLDDASIAYAAESLRLLRTELDRPGCARCPLRPHPHPGGDPR
jgi:S-DNA-T family DNA segregation ATPase FtsK/SpoIIIE